MKTTTLLTSFCFSIFCSGFSILAQDIDNDMVINSLDADDDNDGILDDIENSGALAQIEWIVGREGNERTNSSPLSFFRKTQPIYFGVGFDETTDKNSDNYVLRGVDETTFSDAKIFGDYVELSFAPNEDVLLNGVSLLFSNFDKVPQFNVGNFKMAVEVSDNLSFDAPEMLFPCISIDSQEMMASSEHFNKLEDRLLLKDVEYTFRCYFFDRQNTDAFNRIAFSGIKLPVTVVSLCDFDKDGIINSADLDSDNDGVFDVVESGGIDRNNDGYADDDDDNKNNSNTQGVPTSAGTGSWPVMSTAGILDFLNPNSTEGACFDTSSIAIVK